MQRFNEGTAGAAANGRTAKAFSENLYKPWHHAHRGTSKCLFVRIGR
jgi:hypothetical protein